MIIYSGTRKLHNNETGKTDIRSGVCVVKTADGKDLKSLAEYADGNPFDWGYIGVRPINLARSLLVNYFKKDSDDEYFNRVVFRFCKEFLKGVDYMDWELEETELKNYLTRVVQEVYGDELYETAL